MKKTPQELVDALMKNNMSDVENHFIKWFNYLFKDYQINGFQELTDNNIVWAKLADATRLKNVAFDSEFFAKKTLENYVKMLTEIWDTKKVKIFEPFSQNLKQSFSEDFTFEEDYIDFIYSHTIEVVYVILLVTFLTACEIQKIDDDQEAKLFTVIKSFDEMDKSSQVFLEDIVKQVASLFEVLDHQNQEEQLSEQQQFNSLPNQGGARIRVNTKVDMEIFKKIEKQQKIIDEFEKEREQLKSQLEQKQSKIEQQEKIIEENEEKLQTLIFQREDLNVKLQNKKLDLTTTEITEKNETIEKLKQRIEEQEKRNNLLEREDEDHREQIRKLNMQLQNYQQEFEKIQITNRSSHESSQENVTQLKKENEELKAKLKQAQQERFEEKEKGLNLDLKIGQMNIDIQNLKMEKQDLEFKLENLEQANNILNGSDIYEDDFNQIAEELNSEEWIKQVRNSEEQSPQRVEQIFKGYENKCLNRLKVILNENVERKERVQEVQKQNEDLKNEMQEIFERNQDLEANIVLDMIKNNATLQKIFNATAENQSEIAQDLLKTIMKNEYEIERLKMNRRKQQEQFLDKEASNLEKLQTIYAVVEHFLTK